ncbi:MAG: hypothetical protein R3F39_05170 [Myxococcota bacterium]
MSDMGDRALRRTMRAGLERIAVEVGTLVGVSVLIGGKAVRPARGTAASALGASVYRVTTKLRHSGEEAGFIFPAEALTACGAALMMVPPPAELTRELMAAFDEVARATIGAWNGVVEPPNRLAADDDARRVVAMRDDELAALADRPGVAVALAPLQVAGRETTMAVYGPAAWLALEDRTPPSAETRAVPATPKSGAAADGYVLVDESGVLGEWLRERMNAGDLRVYRRRADDPPETGSTVLVVNATAAQLQAAAGGDWLVMRR